MHRASTQDVQVQVVDRLATVCAGVGDDAEAIRKAFLFRNLRRNEHEVTQQRLVRCHGVRR